MSQEDDQVEAEVEEKNTDAIVSSNLFSFDGTPQQSTLNSVDDEDKSMTEHGKEDAKCDDSKSFGLIKNQDEEMSRKIDAPVIASNESDNYYSNSSLNINLNINNLDIKTNAREKRIENEANSSLRSNQTIHPG